VETDGVPVPGAPALRAKLESHGSRAAELADVTVGGTADRRYSIGGRAEMALKWCTFKGEDFDEASGEDLGPVILSSEDGSEIEELPGWMTRSQAKAIAVERGLEFDVDGPTDEELEEFKREQGYA
jgi:hypothetical protein